MMAADLPAPPRKRAGGVFTPAPPHRAALGLRNAGRLPLERTMTTDTTTPRPTPGLLSNAGHCIYDERGRCRVILPDEDAPATWLGNEYGAGVESDEQDKLAVLIECAINSYTRNTRDPLAAAEGDLLRDLLELAELAVTNERKADELRDSGMVDYVDIKALRAIASAARAAIAAAKGGAA